MARRKQAKPQHVKSNAVCMQFLDDGDHISLETAPQNAPGSPICEELSAPFDLKHHKRICCSQSQEHRTTDSMNVTSDPVHCLFTTTVRELEEIGNSFAMEDHITQRFQAQTECSMAFENYSQNRTGDQQWPDTPVSPSALTPALKQSVSPLPVEHCSWRNTTSMPIENLQSTKVALAQFSQQTQEENCHIGTGTTTVSSLLGQILSLQVQQTNQIQLTNEICHQVLLFACENVKIPGSPLSFDQEPSSQNSASLIDLCSDLSKQLVLAARTAQCLATQSLCCAISELQNLISTNQQSLGSDSVHFHSDFHSSQGLRNEVQKSRLQKCFSKTEGTGPGIPNPQCNDLKAPSLAFDKKRQVNKTPICLPFTQSTSQWQISCNPVRNLVTSLAEQKNQKSFNIPLSGPKASSNNCFLKHSCRFCSKLFRSDSALQIHVRSHTGQRPYKCNICGNRFSTRGNLRVHFQRHNKHNPHIQMNLYPISQDPDNIQTSTGVPYGLSILPEKSSTRWIQCKPWPDNRTTSSWMHSLGSPKQPYPIKQEGISFLPCSNFSHNLVQLASKTIIPTDSAVNTQGSALTMNCNKEEPTSLTRLFEMTSSTAFDNLYPNNKPSCHSISEDLFQTNGSVTTLKFIESSVDPSETEQMNQIKVTPIPIPSLCEREIYRNPTCDVCGKNYACQSALDIHHRTHTRERPFICPTCKRGFSTKGNFKQHMLTHQIRTLLPSHTFKPSHPNRKTTIGCLSHSRDTGATRKEGVAPVRSWLSGGAASAPFSTVPARRTAKQHRCWTCGKMFSSSSALQIHNRTHTGEKPFSCTVCLRAFTTKGNLKVHMGTHVWNCAPSRKGSRLLTNGPLVPMARAPVTLSALQQNKPSGYIQAGGFSVLQ